MRKSHIKLEIAKSIRSCICVYARGGKLYLRQVRRSSLRRMRSCVSTDDPHSSKTCSCMHMYPQSRVLAQSQANTRVCTITCLRIPQNSARQRRRDDGWPRLFRFQLPCSARRAKSLVRPAAFELDAVWSMISESSTFELNVFSHTQSAPPRRTLPHYTETHLH